ncbi:Nin one binding (NOB1) Zn-ribbon like [Novymonas esmeraldas]|uniref:Nin one binding (NOB1) Zn-ribbon like n=1 Tax=Novymonas esmeraldas TaxID=1808958 RepID=A0AAW0F565_9TRYP
MSWAALVKSIKPEEAANFTAKPKTVVYAVDATQNEAERQLQNPLHATAEVKLPSFSKGLLVLDANAIIKGMNSLLSTADALVTTPQVIAEIKDRASRELLERLLHRVTVLDPTPEAVSAVVACAERTGDFGAMSRTDIRLCALALDCCRVGGFLGEQIEPRPPQVNPGNSDRVQVVTEEMSDDGSDAGDVAAATAGDAEQTAPRPAPGPSSGAMPGWGDWNGDAAAAASGASSERSGDDGDDGEGAWITPENIGDVQSGAHGTGRAFEAGMACVTSDYAMQNTLMHLGVPIVGTNGMHIHELRLWLMRCTACFAIVVDTTRQFCPECGSGDTLRRVNYVVNDQGEKKLFINFRKRISTRGTIYNLPKPRGGHRGTNRNLVLREDQLAHVIRSTTSSKAKEQQVMESGDDALAAFGEMPKPKKKNLAEPRVHSSYHKYNINEKKKARAAHRK